jgi:hypothetical protein
MTKKPKEKPKEKYKPGRKKTNRQMGGRGGRGRR